MGIKNGKIVDGTASSFYRDDIGIIGNRIESIGRIDKNHADRVIDVEGLHVTPCFIDLHSEFLDPQHMAEGMIHVRVDGVPVLLDEELDRRKARTCAAAVINAYETVVFAVLDGLKRFRNFALLSRTHR